jgi:hypothetical protein
MSIASPTELYIRAAGKATCAMEKVLKSGQMELVMKDSGARTRHMVKGNFGMWMETFLKGSGKMIRLTAGAPTPT